MNTTIVDAICVIVADNETALAQTADTLRQIVGAYDARPDQGTAAGDIFRTTIDEAAIACAALLIVITDRDKKAEQKPALLLP